MILLLSDDLLDASKTIAAARAHGHTALQCRTMAVLLEQLARQRVASVIVDLQNTTLDLIGLRQARETNEGKPSIIAYGSHVDAGRLKEAREAGCEEVMPRSKYFEGLEKRFERGT